MELKSRSCFVLGAGAAALVLVLDQLSKWWVITRLMNPPRVIEITPFFNFVMWWNKGVTFGLFASAPGWGRWVMVALSLAITAILVIWLLKVNDKLLALAIGLVIGGAVGNVIDRIRFTAVADFLDFHVGLWHWPAFNLADSAITIGVGLLLIDAFLARREPLD
ncbi:MAG: signal peptidase II [Alphaproteobacteria bacterium]